MAINMIFIFVTNFTEFGQELPELGPEKFDMFSQDIPPHRCGWKYINIKYLARYVSGPAVWPGIGYLDCKICMMG